MAEVKFGRRQLTNPTPKGIAFKFNVAIAIATAVSGWVSTTPYIPSQPSSLITSLLSLAVLILMSLKPFYGVETTEKEVPIEDVGQMETEHKP